MKTYNGSCHCGAIQFTFSASEIKDAMRCDCSMCLRKGTMLTSDKIPPDQMKITAEKDVQKTYRFGTLTARHHFCGICGIHVFVETRLNPGQYRVNLGCVDGLDAMKLPEVFFDGKAI